MCGISGIVRFDGDVVCSDTLDRMQESIAHRGPDDLGSYIEGPIGIAHRRLSIIDIASGHQPITCQDGRYTIVYNGEVYNFQKLRIQLEKEGCKFTTQTDTEVVLNAYIKWGLNGILKLNGMFALAIWDSQKQEMFIARDRVGIKPYYYIKTENYVAFSSEVKALLASGLAPREVNKSVLAEYLALYYVPGENTLFKGVKRLLPGEWMRISVDGQIDRGKYWEFNLKPSSEKRNKQDCAAELQGLVSESIKDQLVADVQVGVFLSGGVDSGIVATEMSRTNGSGIKSFTIDYDIAAKSIDNEFKYAKYTADQAGCQQFQVSLTKEHILQSLPLLIYHMDEPIVEPVMAPTYFLSKAAREQDVKVILSGEGPDELFSGYLRFKIARYADLLKDVPKFMRYAAYQLSKRLFGEYDIKSKILLSSLEGHNPLSWLQVFQNAEILALTGTAPFKLFEEKPIFCSSPSSLLDSMLLIDTNLRLPDFILMRGDKMTMANSLEMRPPLLDNRIVDFASALPNNMKLNFKGDKDVLRNAYKDRVHPKITKRPKKPFASPFSYVLPVLTKMFLLDSHCAQAGMLKQSEINLLIDGDDKYGNEQNIKIYSLIVLEIWYRIHIDESLDPHNYVQG